ncbi:RNA polymerase II-associated protein 2, partial [Tremellales sp. Uapishka_1]
MSRPTPSRTLRQPHLLSVASRESSGRLTQPFNDDHDSLRRTLTHKVKLQRKLEKWMDVLMESTVDLATFKRACSLFQPYNYREILHERHLNARCSYPLCANPPRRPYTSNRQIAISTSSRTIREVEGNEEDGYCSRICGTKSEWVERNLKDEPIWLRAGPRAKGKGEDSGFDLLEEMEDRGEIRWEGGKMVRVDTKPPVTPKKK